MQLPWYIPAIAAAVVWGVHYLLIENALKRVSLVTVVLLTAAPMALVALAFPARLAADWRALTALPPGERWLILAIALTSLAGTVLLYLAVRGRNATLASLIEISYPAFVAVFAWLLFREWQLNAGVLLGAGLVFAGTVLIILNSR
ncbi:MAG: DMT family transporter [Chromatiales bacterium]|nr:DMT family transporter [Chromatiales bacterium]